MNASRVLVCAAVLLGCGPPDAPKARGASEVFVAPQASTPGEVDEHVEAPPLQEAQPCDDSFFTDPRALDAAEKVRAIARGAVAAFEREIALDEEIAAGGDGVVRRVCTSAIDVPAAVPRGVGYLPRVETDRDFDTGDDRAGWRCLRFALTTEQHYQFSYRAYPLAPKADQGSVFKGAAVGAPDPGPGGFEASAEGDLDGDGVTSLILSAGQINPQTQNLRRVRELWCTR